jgi:hypothetical protein
MIGGADARPKRPPLLFCPSFQQEHTHELVCGNAVSPAARKHAEARIDYYTDLSQAVLRSLRKLSDVNLQFSREVLDDSIATLRYGVLTRPTSAARECAAASRRSTAKTAGLPAAVAQVITEFQSDINEIAQSTCRRARAPPANWPMPDARPPAST